MMGQRSFGLGGGTCAQSVFTHVPLNHIRLCLYWLGKVMKPGSRLRATFSQKPADYPVEDYTRVADGARRVRWPPRPAE